MTICIAAACDDAKRVVVAADRMFTVGPPLNVEFEPPISKIEAMGSCALALGAGNSLTVAEILRRARAKYHNQQNQRIEQIATFVRAEYVQFRDEVLEQQIIKPALGPDYDVFRSRGGTLPQYLQPQAQLYNQIYIQCSQYNLGVEIIVAGVDESGGHIYTITHPGQMVPFDKIGYSSTGSGATHAAIKLALELQHPKSSLPNTLLSVYSAKAAAEVAPGVGKETELYVVSSKGFLQASDELLKELKAAIEEAAKTKPDTKKIEEKHAGLFQNT
jgi:20S proteasome alpha/beta subunit